MEELVWIVVAAVGWRMTFVTGCSTDVRLGQCPRQREGVPAPPGHAEDVVELQRSRKTYFLIQGFLGLFVGISASVLDLLGSPGGLLRA